jgi:hypothetical protein
MISPDVFDPSRYESIIALNERAGFLFQLTVVKQLNVRYANEVMIRAHCSFRSTPFGVGLLVTWMSVDLIDGYSN